jgi:hypothetical protein
MATTTLKAETISTSKLSAAIDKAVMIAAERHQVAVSDTNLRLNWELVGRRLRDAAKAQAFASDVSKDITKNLGLKVQPATLQVGKLIYCGFFEKVRMPIERGF